MLSSTWLLLPLFGCGFLSFAGFLYVAAQTQRRLYWMLAGLYGVLGVTAVMLMDRGARDTGMEAIGVALLLGGWAASVAHAFAINPSFLRWKAATERAHAARHARNIARPVGGAMPQDVRRFGEPIGLDRESLPVIGPMPWNPASDRVDVNTADAVTLSRLPGLDAVSARRIVDARLAYGPFDSLEELAALAPLRPSAVVTLRPWVTVGGS